VGAPSLWRALRIRYISLMDQPAATSAILFEAVIVPHRSLSPRGLRTLIAVICLLSGLMMLRFWLIGAWPVVGFSVIEVGLAVFLLRLNAQRARACEMLLLTQDALRIVRTDQHGRRQERRLPVGWLNAVLEEPPGKVPKLLLVAHGVREEVATTLGEEEKRDLWSALCHSLYQLRNPSFDNPQLQMRDEA
jgi:uncharacterized membrane protein